MQRHDKILRQEGLKQLKEIRKQEGKAEKAIIIEKIYKKEMSRDDWAISKNTFNPTQRSGISNVEIQMEIQQINLMKLLHGNG